MRTPLTPLHLPARGQIHRRLCTALLASLPHDIAQRELTLVKRMMAWPDDCFQVRTLDDCGPGNVLTIEIESEHLTEVFTGFGQRGVRAEAVAEEALQQAKKYLAANVPVGHYLADQLMLPLALAGGGSYLTLPLSRHAQTNMQIIQRFLEIDIRTRQVGHDKWLVEIG